METNPRGIPKAPFIEDIGDYISKNESAQITLKKFTEAINKYKFMEINTMQRRKGLEDKIPEIEKSLKMVEFIMNREDVETPIETSFELYDTLYVQAKVEQPEKICLWLGANVMLEYTLQEAKDLLSTKLKAAKQSHENACEDLDFLRDQITTMEVNTARTYNWDVKQRRLAKSS
ncbi:Prefoldin subunit 3 [Smittium culicis]|uniref:Prefoldin subunit 3 n=1 Tax=Smittium culicis TaxID=133412 RepID=A0A1R1XBQ4_9FUNG|nr:Prefoldin subunit 3 [Smittium culicis]